LPEPTNPLNSNKLAAKRTEPFFFFLFAFRSRLSLRFSTGRICAARYVVGFHAWHKLGRFVKKSEKGILWRLA
jgi:hypothetical protein